MSAGSNRLDSVGPRSAVAAIQPHQQLAIAVPRQPLKALAGPRRVSANRLARIVNDFLADPQVR
jgi:hypothetical protein